MGGPGSEKVEGRWEEYKRRTSYPKRENEKEKMLHLEKRKYENQSGG
jgi:hypothetical protein